MVTRETVAAMLATRRGDGGVKGVVSILNRQGEVTRCGRPWTVPSLYAFMAGPDYLRKANQRRQQRLRDARARNGAHTVEQWRALCEVFLWQCVTCGKRPIEKDHIIPLCHPESTDDIGNLQPLCSQCNRSQGMHMTDHRQTAPTVCTPEMIRWLRAALRESVDTFGERFSRSGRTVEDWEQGRRRPDTLVLLALIKLKKRIDT